MSTSTSARPAGGVDIASTPPAGRSGSPRSARKRRGGSFQASRRRLFWPFVAPGLSIFVILLLVPLAGTAWISLHQWPGAGPMTWVGFDNYTYLFRDPVFMRSFINTGLVVFVAGAGIFVVSFILLALLKDMIGRGRAFARSVIFFPVIVPAIALSILWGFLFQSDGLINSGLELIGIVDPPAWLAAENRFAVILLGIMWMNTGFYTTILLAGADQIPKYLYEETALAGANMWQRFRYVTLPLTWDVVTVCAVLWVINALKTFEFIIAFAGSSSGLPDIGSWTVALYSFATVMRPSGIPVYGISAASSILTLLLVAVLVVLIRRIMRRDAIEL